MTKTVQSASAPFRRALAVVLLAGALLFGVGIAPANAEGPAPIAEASVSTAGGVAARPDFCGPDGMDCFATTNSDASFYTSIFRPINRWGDATQGFFSKYDGFVGTQIAEMAQRNLSATLQMGIGNWLTKSTGDMVQMAASNDLLSSVGESIDSVTRGISTVFITATGGASTQLLALLIVLGIVTIAVVTVRGRAGLALFLRRALSFGLVVGALISMAIFSQTPATNTAGVYSPAPGTPTWIVKTVTDTISKVGSVPTQAFLQATKIAASATSSGSEDQDPLSCTSYISTMDSMLSTLQSAGSTKSSTAAVVDQFWASTGLTVWKKVQTGVSSSDDGVNRFGERTFCRILDGRSGAAGAASSAVAVTSMSAPEYARAVKAAKGNAPFAPVGNANTAATYVAWAACVPTGVNGEDITWNWDDAWVGYKGDEGIKGSQAQAQEQCSRWWNMAGDDNLPDMFDVNGDAGWITDNTKTITDEANRKEVSSYLVALTGVSATGSGGDTAAYVFGAGLTFLAFAWISLLVLIANLMTVFFAVSIWFVLIRALFDTEPLGQVIAPAFKRFIGTAVVASTVTVLMALVVLVSQVLNSLGTGLFGASNAFGMLWAGLSPVMAIVLIHIAFKQLFKRPSPFTLSGAKSWAQAGTGGAIGAAMVSGAGRLGRRTGGAAASGAKAGGDALLHKATGGRMGSPLGVSARRSAMSGKAAQIQSRGQTGSGEVAGEQRGQASAQAPVGYRAQAAAWRDEWVEKRKAYRSDLQAARADYQAETGEVAPGDLRGAIRQRAANTGAAMRTKSAQMGDRISGAIANTRVARGVQLRSEARLMSKEEMDSPALQAYFADQRSTLSRGSRAAAAVIDAPAAVASRTRLGVQQGSSAVWNSRAATNLRAEASGIRDSKPVQAIAAGSAAAAHGAKYVRDVRTQNAHMVEQYRQKQEAGRAAAAATAKAERKAQRAETRQVLPAQPEQFRGAGRQVRTTQADEKGQGF